MKNILISTLLVTRYVSIPQRFYKKSIYKNL